MNISTETDTVTLVIPTKHRDSHPQSGPVGSKWAYCYECQRKVRNVDYEEESRMLKRIARRNKKK